MAPRPSDGVLVRFAFEDGDPALGAGSSLDRLLQPVERRFPRQQCGAGAALGQTSRLGNRVTERGLERA